MNGVEVGRACSMSAGEEIYIYIYIWKLLFGEHNNNNNNNKGSRGMGEVAPLYGVDSALVLTNPGVQ